MCDGRWPAGGRSRAGDASVRWWMGHCDANVLSAHSETVTAGAKVPARQRRQVCIGRRERPACSCFTPEAVTTTRLLLPGESSSPPCDRRGRRPAVESHGKGKPARRLGAWLGLSEGSCPGDAGETAALVLAVQEFVANGGGRPSRRRRRSAASRERTSSRGCAGRCGWWAFHYRTRLAVGHGASGFSFWAKALVRHAGD